MIAKIAIAPEHVAIAFLVLLLLWACNLANKHLEDDDDYNQDDYIDG